MLIVVVFMLAGLITGFLLRCHSFKYQNQIIMVLIWILLFLLGIEVGSNEQVVKQSGKIIFQAFLIATFGTLGSVLAAKILWNYIRKKSNDSSKEKL